MFLWECAEAALIRWADIAQSHGPKGRSLTSDLSYSKHTWLRPIIRLCCCFHPVSLKRVSERLMCVMCCWSRGQMQSDFSLLPFPVFSVCVSLFKHEIWLRMFLWTELSNEEAESDLSVCVCVCLADFGPGLMFLWFWPSAPLTWPANQLSPTVHLSANHQGSLSHASAQPVLTRTLLSFSFFPQADRTKLWLQLFLSRPLTSVTDSDIFYSILFYSVLF